MPGAPGSQTGSKLALRVIRTIPEHEIEGRNSCRLRYVTRARSQRHVFVKSSRSNKHLLRGSVSRGSGFPRVRASSGLTGPGKIQDAPTSRHPLLRQDLSNWDARSFHLSTKTKSCKERGGPLEGCRYIDVWMETRHTEVTRQYVQRVVRSKRGCSWTAFCAPWLTHVDWMGPAMAGGETDCASAR